MPPTLTLYANPLNNCVHDCHCPFIPFVLKVQQIIFFDKLVDCSYLTIEVICSKKRVTLNTENHQLLRFLKFIC